MYHIKNDLRCRKSADAISRALFQLLKRKKYTDISISDIQRASGVGRSTFYRLFDNLDDVISFRADQDFKTIAGLYQSLPYRDFTLACLEYFMKTDRELLNIVTSGRMDIIIHSLRRNLMEIQGNGSIAEAGYALAVFTGACLSIITVWNEHGQKETAEELFQILDKYLNTANMVKQPPSSASSGKNNFR